MHRGKIKRLSLFLFPSVGRFSSRPFRHALLQLTINLLLNLYQECLHVVRLKETSRAAPVFSPFFLDCRDPRYRFDRTPETTIHRENSPWFRYITVIAPSCFSRLHASLVVD